MDATVAALAFFAAALAWPFVSAALGEVRANGGF